MKTMKQVTSERPEFSRLIRAVVRSIGLDSVPDVNAHGIDGGFSGFIYTRETVAFFDKHRDDILNLAGEMAGNLGEDLLSMVQSFRCVGKDYSPTEIGEALFSAKTSDAIDVVRNGMAWFAAEEVCRMFDE